MKTLTAQVAREIVATSQDAAIFNDRLKDGRRSLKVWDWSDEQYEEAAKKLRDLGCKAEVVSVRSFNAYTGGIDLVTRLYVTEPK